MRELNPRSQLGRLEHGHYANIAKRTLINSDASLVGNFFLLRCRIPLNRN